MQKPLAVVGDAIPPTPPFSVEVEEHIFKRLSDLANKEQIPLKPLASQLLARMLCYHRGEIREIIAIIKKRAFG